MPSKRFDPPAHFSRAIFLSLVEFAVQEPAMSHAINDEALDTIFRDRAHAEQMAGQAGQHGALMAVYDLMRWGPTSANMSPARIVFVVSKEAKERLEAASLATAIVDKTMSAPVTAIIGYDLEFPGRCRNSFRMHRAPRTGSRIPRSRRSTRSATARCRAPISSSPRAHWASIAGRCRASTMRASIANSSRARRSNRTSCAMSAMAIRRAVPAQPPTFLR